MKEMIRFAKPVKFTGLSGHIAWQGSLSYITYQESLFHIKLCSLLCLCSSNITGRHDWLEQWVMVCSGPTFRRVLTSFAAGGCVSFDARCAKPPKQKH